MTFVRKLIIIFIYSILFIGQAAAPSVITDDGSPSAAYTNSPIQHRQVAVTFRNIPDNATNLTVSILADCYNYPADPVTMTFGNTSDYYSVDGDSYSVDYQLPSTADWINFSIPNTYVFKGDVLTRIQPINETDGAYSLKADLTADTGKITYYYDGSTWHNKTPETTPFVRLYYDTHGETPVEKIVWMCTGDSISKVPSDYVPGDEYVTKLGTLLGSGYSVVSEGVGSEYIHHSTFNFSAQLDANKPDIASILIGINDIALDYDPKETAKWVINNATMANNRGIDTYIYTLTPYNSKTYADEVAVYNTYLYDNCPSNVTLIDLYDTIDSTPGDGVWNSYNPLYMHDNVHPNAAGNTLIAQKIYNVHTDGNYTNPTLKRLRYISLVNAFLNMLKNMRLHVAEVIWQTL